MFDPLQMETQLADYSFSVSASASVQDSAALAVAMMILNFVNQLADPGVDSFYRHFNGLIMS